MYTYTSVCVHVRGDYSALYDCCAHCNGYDDCDYYDYAEPCDDYSYSDVYYGHFNCLTSVAIIDMIVTNTMIAILEIVQNNEECS